jgi:hypothetical protein
MTPTTSEHCTKVRCGTVRVCSPLCECYVEIATGQHNRGVIFCMKYVATLHVTVRVVLMKPVRWLLWAKVPSPSKICPHGHLATHITDKPLHSPRTCFSYILPDFLVIFTISRCIKITQHLSYMYYEQIRTKNGNCFNNYLKTTNI